MSESAPPAAGFPAPSDLRIAVLGAGTMGSDHVGRLGTITGAQATAVVEPDEARGRAALSAAGDDARWFPSAETALAAGGIDALLVASPGRFHEEALHLALDARMPTFCEKPLTLTSDAARRVVDHELRLDRPLIHVGFHRRFDAGYLALKEAIEDRRLGEVLALHCRHRNPAVPEAWTSDLLIEDACAHEMDVVAWLTDEPITSVDVRTGRRNRANPEGVHDPLMVMLRTAGGVLADVEINMNFRAGYQVLTEAVLEQGAIAIGNTHGPLVTAAGRIGTEEHRSYVTRFADAYDLEVQRWVDSVREDGPLPGATAWDGLRATVLCEAGIESLRSGRRVEVPAEERPAFYRDALG